MPRKTRADQMASKVSAFLIRRGASGAVIDELLEKAVEQLPERKQRQLTEARIFRRYLKTFHKFGYPEALGIMNGRFNEKNPPFKKLFNLMLQLPSPASNTLLVFPRQLVPLRIQLEAALAFDALYDPTCDFRRGRPAPPIDTMLAALEQTTNAAGIIAPTDRPYLASDCYFGGDSNGLTLEEALSLLILYPDFLFRLRRLHFRGAVFPGGNTIAVDTLEEGTGTKIGRWMFLSDEEAASRAVCCSKRLC